MTTEEDIRRERVRQSERTVDNLKRLYAVLFAISFGVVAASTYEKIQNFDKIEQFGIESIILHAEMTIAFIITAGLFYYQGDRFLDVVYAKEPLAPVGPFQFGIDYLVNVFTMVPFFLMAHALAEKFTSAVGFTWFFVSYVLLIGLGLALLIFRDAFSLIQKPASESAQISALKVFWLSMNSFLLLCLVGMYALFITIGDTCPANYHGKSIFGFPLVMGILIFSRDYLDFTRGWAILYPVDGNSRHADLLAPIPWLTHKSARVRARVFSLVVIALLIFLIWKFDLWDLPAIASRCALPPS
ncbi:hypothetical protein FJ987_02790 [Mesorhizobium sp. CU2]|uniref:hypothetical protein n=1 Tax=unclassified Mesorhizobium TaxID=325217 RepID=UPI00112778F0|nr:MULTISPECIES: hypothetical protein [unclassified Mesorhizobium]TPN84168.1 hypothetical protein FJ988_11115 [Mesorhizobium sp. CU3]TPO21126.1 hypothetical protein FJ987_02790 [Mesorhizobium sp. CU2]